LDLSAWLQEQRTEIEARWLAAARGLPTYVDYSEDERLSYWRPLLEALAQDRAEATSEKVLEWAYGEVDERGASFAELLSITTALSRAVRALLPEGGLDQVDRRLGDLALAVARYSVDEAEQVAVEKAQLETLYGITRELTSSMDLSRGLQKALSEMAEVSGADMGAIFLTDDDVEKVVPETRIGWEGGEVALDKLPPAWQMGQAERLLILDDVEAERAGTWVEEFANEDTASLMLGPLVANGQFRGLIALASPKVGLFGPNHVQLFRHVLGQVSTAIANAEVYRLISQQAQELGQMFRRQQEQATEKQAILTSIADGVVVNDTEGKIIMVNPAAERILDMVGGQLIGKEFYELFAAFSSSGKEEAIEAMETLLSSSVPEMTKTSNKMSLEIGDRIIHALLSPVLSEQSDFLGVATIFRDVTKEVEADRAKSEFVSTVSHELRTPMTAIKGYTDLLYAGAAGTINPEQKRFLSTIKSNTDRLTALINDLLDISRMETGRVRFEPRLLQLGEVIADVVNVLAAQAEAKSLNLTYEVAAGLPEVMGDQDRLHQVLTNLIGNAIYYTPEGGEIELRAYPVEEAVRVDVRDTGIGIAPEDMGHIFERFYRADHPLVQETRGTGLGLSIVKMFVEMHGGRIWVESEPEKGSTFTFILPLPYEEGEERVRRTPPRLKAHVRTILVVDDDRNAADLAKRRLEDGGYKVLIMGRGRTVEQYAEERQPDLILLDLILPDVGGLDVLRDLKENPVTADIPVVVQTIVPDDGTAQELGAVDYLTKPVDRELMLQSVEQALTWQGRVLIVEDDPDTVGLLEATMRQVGFTPLVASDGYEAMTMTRRYRPDLILLDLRLPGMDGYEALTHLKRDAVTQTIPIIAISAHVADVDQESKRLVALGAASFLPKPFSIGELLNEVEAALKSISGPSLPN